MISMEIHGSIEMALTATAAQTGLYYLHGDQFGTANFVTHAKNAARDLIKINTLKIIK